MLAGSTEGLGQTAGCVQSRREETLSLSFGWGRMSAESEEEAACLEVCCNRVAQGKASEPCHTTAPPNFLQGLGSLMLGESSEAVSSHSILP